MSLKDVISPERLALESAYTEEEAREEALALLRDADFDHVEGCGSVGCDDYCSVRAAHEDTQRAANLIREYKGVTCG